MFHKSQIVPTWEKFSIRNSIFKMDTSAKKSCKNREEKEVKDNYQNFQIKCRDPILP